METKKSVLQEAEELIHGARQQTYDHPYIDFGRTAKMLSGLLKSKLKDGVEIDIEEVPLIMVCVKLSRLIATPGHRDSMVDGPGYFGTYEMVMDRKAELEARKLAVELEAAVPEFLGDKINKLMERERYHQNLRAMNINPIGDPQGKVSVKVETDDGSPSGAY